MRGKAIFELRKKNVFNVHETLDSERGGIDVHRSAGFKTLELPSAVIWRSHMQPMKLLKIGIPWTVVFWHQACFCWFRGAVEC